MIPSIFSPSRPGVPHRIRSHVKTVLISSIPLVGFIFCGNASLSLPSMGLQGLCSYPEELYRKRFTQLKAFSVGLFIQTIALIALRVLYSRPKGMFILDAWYIITTLGFSISSMLESLVDERRYNHFKADPKGFIEETFRKNSITKDDYDKILVVYDKNKDNLFL